MLTIYKKDLIEQTDTISLFKKLKTKVRFTFDVDSLTRVAFNELKPFPSRNEIQTKQGYYNKILSESWTKRQLNYQLKNQQEKMVNIVCIFFKISKNKIL